METHILAENAVKWIKDYADKTGMKKAIIGISGGKDSYVAAALCCRAIGNENVIGVIMPNGEMTDFDDAMQVCNNLCIDWVEADISKTFDAIEDCCNNAIYNLSTQNKISNEARINIAPRLRMSVLYALGQTLGARVCGTGNLSERTVGYCTKWGDTACDFNPLGNMTSDEVIAVGDYLGLLEYIVHKTPADGLSGKTDEEKLGIPYSDINKYIVYPDKMKDENEQVYLTLRNMEIRGYHKISTVPIFKFNR